MRAALRSLVVLLLLLLAPAAVSAQDDAWQQAQGQEKILNYLSEVTVAPSGDLDVTETIRIVALNQQIRHGIYRDFPTSYADNLGHRLHVGFAVVSVQRDGKDEPWSRENLSNGVRIRIVGLQVDHQQAQRHAHLDGGKADTRRFIHRFEHVIDQRLQLVIERLDTGGYRLQPRIGHFQDFTNSHGF